MIVEKELVCLKIVDSWGFNKDIAIKLSVILSELKPLYLRFLSPNLIIAFYEISVNMTKINNSFEKIKEIIKANKENLERTKIVKMNSTFIIKKRFGKYEMPIGGDLINENNCIVFNT